MRIARSNPSTWYEAEDAPTQAELAADELDFKQAIGQQRTADGRWHLATLVDAYDAETGPFDPDLF
jgi:hypothetical protein